MVVEVVHQVVGVPGAGRVGDQTSPGVPPGSVPEESSASEHEQRRVVHEVEHCQQPVEQAIRMVIATYNIRSYTEVQYTKL